MCEIKAAEKNSRGSSNFIISRVIGKMWDQWDILTNLILEKQYLPVTTPFSFSHCGTEILARSLTHFVVADNDCIEV